MTRWAKWLLAIAVLISILLVATPQLLSSRAVKDRIAAQLSELTGRDVMLNGSSSVSLQPYLGVIYRDASIASAKGASGASLATVEELQVQLGFASAFFGKAEVSNVTLIRPRFNLEVDANGARNWELQDGEFAKRLSQPGDETPQRLSLGFAKIVDGTIKFNDELNRVTTEMTAVNGSINWQDITSSVDSKITAVWNGEIINLELAAAAPLELLRGGVSSTRAVLKSKALTVVFDGFLDTKLNTAKGTFSSLTPSIKSVTDWLSLRLPLANMTTAFELSGELSAAEGKVTMENAKISIAGHDALGQLQFAKKKNTPLGVSGTLAFETLDIPSLPRMSFGGAQTPEQSDQVDLSKLGAIDMDIGVSSKSMTYESASATNVAASMMLRKGAMRLEIGNAEILDGTISGFLDGQPKSKSYELQSNFLLSQVNLAEMSTLVSGTSKALTGTGDAEIKLSSSFVSGAETYSNLNGSLEIKGKDGTINGIDLQAVYDLSNQNEDTPVQYVDGVTRYDTLQLNFLIVNNTAFLRESALVNPNLKATLTGRGKYDIGTLAMRGNIESAEEDSTAVPLPFFIGGTIASPLFVPLPRPGSN